MKHHDQKLAEEIGLFFFLSRKERMKRKAADAQKPQKRNSKTARYCLLILLLLPKKCGTGKTWQTSL
jgi:hypothetical protein